MAGRTTLIMGAVHAELSLVKASSAPSAAKWETKTVAAQPSDEGVLGSGDLSSSATDAPSEVADDVMPVDPFGSTIETPVRGPRGAVPVIPQTIDQARAQAAPAATKTLRGVTNDAGEFVDLTDELAQIDATVKLPGMIVAAAIPAGSVPRERVRDASYLSPIDPLGSKVCTLLYDVLRAENRALAVRWTKRTNQALGIIVASSRHKALMLLELEWSANMTAPSKRVQQATQAQVSEGELDAATKFVQALSRPASALDELEDERAVLNARLLEAAREGTDEPDLTVDRPDAGELEVLLAGGGS